MCPDRQLLSVYCDGELPSPWKEKLESHLSLCASCAGLLEDFRGVSLRESESDSSPAREAALKQAQDRVWQNLEARANAHEAKAAREREAARFWGRRISLPLPAAAAAAALLFAAFAVLWAMRPAGQTAVSNMASAPAEAGGQESYAPRLPAAGNSQNFDQGGIVPAASMDDVLRYLGNRDSGDIIILRLPESRNFTSAGEPAIIKAADYSRGNR